MEDIKKIQEFFSKSLEENIVVRMYNTTDKTADLYKEDNPGLEFYLTGKEGQDYVRKYKDHISFPFSSHMNDGTPIPNYEENKEKLAAYLKQKGIPFKTTSAKPYRGVSRTTGEDFMYTTDTFKVPLSHVDIKDISLEENTFKKGDKVTYLGNPAEITFVGKDQMDRTYYSVSYDKGNGKTKASNLYNKGGEIKPLNENKVTKEDFDKVVKILSKSKYPFTIMLVPKWDEIDIITGNDSPDEIVDDISQRLDLAGLNWGGNSGITISGDSSNYSRKEYSDIFKVNGGHKDYFEEAKVEVDDKTEFKLDLKHLLDKHVVEQGYSLTKEHETDPNMELKVGDYQTQHFHMCPGAKSLYQDIENKVEDMGLAIRSAKLQDALFAMEESALENGANEADVFAAETIADQIMAMAAMMGLDKEHSYIQGHVDKIKGALDKGQVAEASKGALNYFNDLKYYYQKAFRYLDVEEREEYKQLAKDFFSKLQIDDKVRAVGLEEMMSLDDQAKVYYLAKVKRGEIDTLPEDPKAAFLAQMNEASEEQNLQNLVGKTIAEIEENDGFAYNIKIVFEDGTKFTLDLWKKHDDAGIDWSIKDGGNSIFSDKDKIYEFNYKNYPKDNIKAIQVQLDQLGVKYEMDPKNKVQPFKVIYKPVNKSDDFYDKFDDIVFRYNLKSVVKTSLKETAAYIAETIKLGMMVNEELCEKGKRYIKARQAAGEKSSAYLSGRAVRVCKGQIEWPKKGKKKKTNESLVNEGQKINQNLDNLLNKIKKDFNIDNEQI